MRKKEIRKFDTFAVSARVLGIVKVVFKWFVESKYQNGFDKKLVKSEHIHFHYQIQFTLLSFQTQKKNSFAPSKAAISWKIPPISCTYNSELWAFFRIDDVDGGGDDGGVRNTRRNTVNCGCSCCGNIIVACIQANVCWMGGIATVVPMHIYIIFSV